MLHLLYIIAFTVLAVIAVSNMLSNLVKLGTQVRQPVPPRGNSQRSVSHPELLDNSGEVINEPLLVMRSISIKDARDQLDALYEASSGNSSSSSDDNKAKDS
ncbi:MAG: DUF2973 domain-containing protein [Phormidesmis sp.]